MGLDSESHAQTPGRKTSHLASLGQLAFPGHDCATQNWYLSEDHRRPCDGRQKIAACSLSVMRHYACTLRQGSCASVGNSHRSGQSSACSADHDQYRGLNPVAPIEPLCGDRKAGSGLVRLQGMHSRNSTLCMSSLACEPLSPYSLSASWSLSSR